MKRRTFVVGLAAAIGILPAALAQTAGAVPEPDVELARVPGAQAGEQRDHVQFPVAIEVADGERGGETGEQHGRGGKRECPGTAREADLQHPAAHSVGPVVVTTAGQPLFRRSESGYWAALTLLMLKSDTRTGGIAARVK